MASEVQSNDDGKANQAISLHGREPRKAIANYTVLVEHGLIRNVGVPALDFGIVELQGRPVHHILAGMNLQPLSFEPLQVQRNELHLSHEPSKVYDRVFDEMTRAYHAQKGISPA